MGKLLLRLTLCGGVVALVVMTNPKLKAKAKELSREFVANFKEAEEELKQGLFTD